MDERDPLDMIHLALSTHGIAATRSADHVRLDRHDLRFGAAIVDRDLGGGSHMLVLEIVIFSPLLGAQPVIESFAGFGETRQDAILLAFEKFLRGVFHPVLEALADHVCASMQADVERWVRDDAAWKVHSGPVIAQSVGESALMRSYPDFYRTLKGLFVETARPGAHVLRIFVAGYDSTSIQGEVVLDNQSWPEGEDLLRDHDWRCGEPYETVRQIILALPAGASAPRSGRRS